MGTIVFIGTFFINFWLSYWIGVGGVEQTERILEATSEASLYLAMPVHMSVWVVDTNNDILFGGIA